MERSRTGIHVTLFPISGSSICVGIRQAFQILALLLPGCASLGQLTKSPQTQFPPL